MFVKVVATIARFSDCCVPATGNQYDGICASATKAIPLTGAPVTQMIHWARPDRRQEGRRQQPQP